MEGFFKNNIIINKKLVKKMRLLKHNRIITKDEV